MVRDRFLGTVIGLAVGDALGSQYEGRSATSLAAEFGSEPAQMTGGGRFKLALGEWADDTAQVQLTMDSFVASRGFSGLDVALGLVQWAKTRPRTMGPHTADVVSRLSRDPEQWETAGREIWYRNSGVLAGNGALARSTVAALFYWNDIDRMVESTIRLCQLTHFDPRVVDSALVVNFLIVQCLHRRYSDQIVGQARTFLESTRRSSVYRKLALDFDNNTLHEYSNFSPYAPFDRDEDAVLIALEKVANCGVGGLHTSGFAVHSMQLAVWMLMNSSNFMEGVHRAVRLGGDADTQGALTGALLGARLGLAQIPNFWLAPLRDRARLTSVAEVLLDRSEALEEEEFADGKRGPQPLPPPVL